MRRFALLAATFALALAPISANADTRVTDDTTCFPDWHGIILSAQVRGQVLLSIWGDHRHVSKAVDAGRSWVTIDWYPPPSEYVTGRIVTAVARVRTQHTPWSAVETIDGACQGNG